ncbi:hypothetical protein ETB97_012521 [Aspergillus alliaceus]|uniref:Uncharacterized protein n=1 Tax=Petromyces alliaceus TaxID=209559 RepID=A0A5N6FLI8_PETAA|nr:uncharacterized protein BDW43DRAFT_313960 [Aspergillus alliaceus]KAB8230487.1 hypothetical protein BDW43DRAFT_313960 [Aspergillus alliaceus]KAF5866355.1 hypothetical protein ETB97_012521 [Aspergillus burnettii]
MRIVASVTLASLLALAQAHPEGAWWGTDDCYTSPDNTNNDCSDEMRGGFNWAGLTVGSFSAFSGFAFSGFSFSSSFSGSISGGFAGQCIESKLSKDGETSPEISSGSDKTFSISKLHLVTAAEADIKIIYDMPDGSSCKHVAPCSPKGNVIANDQCGGASSVRFELAEEAAVEEVVLGIQNIEFDCSPGQKTPTPSHHHTSPTETGHSSTPLIPVPSSSGAVTATPPAPSTPVSMTTSTVYTTSLVTITSCAPTVTNCPGDSTTVVTSTIAISTTVCPVTPTVTPVKPTGSSPVGGTSKGSSPSSPAPTGTAGTSTGVLPTSRGGSSSVPEGSTTTVVTWETVTTCPVTTTATSGGVTTTSVYSTVSTVTLTSTATVCNKCTATPPTGTPTGTPIVTPTGTSPNPTDVSPEEPPEESATTVVTYTTVTDCPVTTTATAGGSTTTSVYTTQSTVTLTSTSTVCTKCSATPTPTGVSPITTPAQGATTVVTYETVTTCPVTTTITSGGSTTTSVFTTVSTLTKTSSAIVKPVPTSSVPAAPAPSSPAPSASCPNSVPKCINTWLPLLPKCKSNAEPGCFCPNPEFTDKVISCIQAWGASKEEIQAALSYFTGICAAWVPGNPGIVTGVPSTITLIPAPAPTGVAPVGSSGTSAPPKPTAAPAVPATTITYSTYTVTVPQVTFTTGTSGHSTTVGLIPGPAPTGVSPGHSSGIPNPWVSASSTWVSSQRPSSTAKASPTQTPPPLSNSASTGSVFTSFWLAVGVAALFSVFF